MSTTRRVLIMAGGTGGHVFPALAVAGELRRRGVEVVWMGTRAGLEARLVPAAGYPIEWISVSGLRRKGVLSWLMAPVRVGRALYEARLALQRVNPDVVLGMGGFVTGPGGVMAWMLGKKLVIHEQNSIAGLTNRVLSRVANQVLTGFPDTFPEQVNAVVTGNPIRPEIAALASREVPRNPWRVLVLGGSQGAAALNSLVPGAVADLPAHLCPEIWHQTGERDQESTRIAYQAEGVTARVVPFITDMAGAYHWADLVICRSGALTVAEVAAAGVAALLVPYPHAVDDHQTHNAQLLVDAEAALLLPQSTLTRKLLKEMLRSFAEHPERLQIMGRAARTVALPHATQAVVERLIAA